MRVFTSKRFARFARKERISDASLCQAVRMAEQGAIDADYGGGVIKQRIARPNEGKSGGYRSIILFRQGSRAFFVYGFAKNEQANIDQSDERDFKKLAERLLNASDAHVRKLTERGEFFEVTFYEEN
jgi:hypothetical protein